MSETFNKNFNEESEKPEFIFKPSGVSSHIFQLFQYQEAKGDYEPVGEYTVLDMDEPPELTDKKLFNILSVINERSRYIDFTGVSGERTYFQYIEPKDDDLNEKVIFRTYTGSGVSKENAIFTVRKGVFDEFNRGNEQQL